MSSPKFWSRGVQLVALVLSLATPGCLAETDDVEFDDPVALEDQAIDPGTTYDLVEEPALELMAEGHFGDTRAWHDPALERAIGGPETGTDFIGNEGEEDGEPTPQPWHSAASEDPGDEGGPDPVPWDVANLGPDPVPWHNDDDLKASTSGQTEGRQGYDPN